MIVYCPAKALPDTISSDGVTESAEKTSSSTIGPTGEERICGKMTSSGVLRWKTAVRSSTTSTLSRLYSSEDGPLYARTVLETQTAIGVYPKNGRIEEGQFHSQLDYREKDGTLRSKVLSSTYRFPHLT
ncbi:hypothetical protein [Georgenia sp. SUBG003]|uniref:hypothetical protein n=1 Tax=Georgenia sp. SUBG003 TaxID=1497974 RepID=UPI003AB4D6AB